MNGILYTAPNNLAARRTLAPNAARGQGAEESILQLRGRHQDAQHLNIVLAPVIPDPSRAPIVHPCIAIIGWGAGGASTRVEVDFARGTELQLAASFISISGRNDGRVSDGGSGTIDPDPGPQDVIAMISGTGGRSAFGRATRTYYFANLEDHGSSRIAPVAPFAKSLLVTRFPASTAIRITIFDGLSLQTDENTGVTAIAPTNPRDEYEFANVPAPRLELFDRAGVVKIENTGESAIDALQIAYELCL